MPIVPNPTPIFRIMHVDNLSICLQRKCLCAPNFPIMDGLKYKTIHNANIQSKRHAQTIPCGPGGVIHDYVPFYIGPRSPMLYQLHTGYVDGYVEGQEPIIYLISTMQIASTKRRFVFSDGQGIAFNTSWFDSLGDLNKVDWKMVYAKYWTSNYDNDPDRQRRKQAEFLIYHDCPWSLVCQIGVINSTMEARVDGILRTYGVQCPVKIRRSWYY